MIKKKICMLGAFSVGKTSLVRQYVTSVFSEKYHTTVGVKVDKKSVPLNGSTMDLLIWDIFGEDNVQSIAPSYLRGASGYLLVIDGTRKETLHVAQNIKTKVETIAGKLPCVMLANKADLEAEWEIDDATIDELTQEGLRVLRTSAKTGNGVEEAFAEMARRIAS